MKKFHFVKTLTVSFFCLNLFACYCYGGQNINDNFGQFDSIKAVIHKSISWVKTKDFELLYSVIANDSNYIEIDPGSEVIKGFTQFRKNESLWGSPEFKPIRYDIRDLNVNFSKSGDVAWFYCVLDDVNEYKGKVMSWMNTRWTGVLERRQGKWVIVQMHFSFASDK